MKKGNPTINEILTKEYFGNLFNDFFNYHGLLLELNEKKEYNNLNITTVHIGAFFPINFIH